MTIPVVNNAIAGRSARSYTREGRFERIAAGLVKGDFVVIEFGHNDGGTIDPATDKGRPDCPPGTYPNGTIDYSVTCQTSYNGSSETVLTFEAYLVNAAQIFQDLGATVVISTATPNNPWETGNFSWAPDRFVDYAGAAANATNSALILHGQYTANVYREMTAAMVDALFPFDHTHTSPQGATIVAQAFVTALEATNASLKEYVFQTSSATCNRKPRK